jgi:hypothetical protein
MKYDDDEYKVGGLSIHELIGGPSGERYRVQLESSR